MKTVRSKVKYVIKFLKLMTEGQGSIRIVYDSALGEVWGNFHIEHLRDGRFCDIDAHSQKEMVAGMVRVIESDEFLTKLISEM